IQIASCTNLTLSNNTLFNDSIVLGGNEQKNWTSHSIDKSNKVNEKPVFYAKDENNLNFSYCPGQIILANCSDSSIEDFDINSTSIGIELGFSENISLENMSFYDNKIEGIYMYESDDNTIYNSTFVNNQYGVYSFSSNYNHLRQNSFGNNSNGLYYNNSAYNYILKNIFSYNNHSMTLNKSNYNVFANNNFINNNLKIKDIVTNYWNLSYTSGGNYWSYYDGTDGMSGPNQDQPGSDGIGDTPYIIEGDENDDEYPLMEPYNIDTVPPSITNLNLTNIAENSAEIVWSTDELTIGEVRYSPNLDFSNSTIIQTQSYSIDHSVLLTNLSSGSSYYFEIILTDVSGNEVIDNNETNYYRFDTVSTKISKPIINDLTSQTPETDSYFLFEAEIIDESQVIEVYVDYWLDDKNVNNISMEKTDNTWMAYIEIGSNSYDLNYEITARNENNIWNSTETIVLDVIDTSPPSVTIHSSDIANTGENYTINFTVSENREIKQINLTYYTDITSPTKVFQDDLELNSVNENYTYSIHLPQNATELFYNISVIDTSENEYFSHYSQQIEDIIPPNISFVEEIDTLIKAETTAKITAQIEDNIEISKAILTIDKDGVEKSYDMEESENNLWTYNLELKEEGSYTYWIVAEDTSGLINRSYENTFTVIDMAPPQVKIENYIGGILPINENIDLNFTREMDKNSVIHSLDIDEDFEVNWHNDSYLSVIINDVEAGSIYNISINSSIAKDVYGYYLDGNGDGKATQTKENDFVANITYESPPQIQVWTPQIHYKHENITLEIDIQDDIAIEKGWLYYVDTQDYSHNLSFTNTSGLFNISLPRQKRTGNLTLSVFAVDSSGLSNNTDNIKLDVENWMTVDCDDYHVGSEELFDFEVDVYCPTGIKKIKLHMEGSNKSESLKMSEGNNSRGIWTVELNLEEGKNHYVLEIIDTDGESYIDSSYSGYIEVEESSLPYYYLLLLAFIAILGVVSGIYIYKKKSIAFSKNVQDEEKIFRGEVDFLKETESIKKERCTICLSRYREKSRIHKCSKCGETYHMKCIKYLKECPVCGNNDIQNGENYEFEKE
ncbi:MAG: NosD domain-containing protein, partial [Thermoplasmatota archaeon]